MRNDQNILVDTLDIFGKLRQTSKHLKCTIILDGYFVETAFCFLYGLCWYKWGINKLERLHKVPIDEWRVNRQIIINDEYT